ncbi:MAG: MBL fold metallo-hydrolase [Pseudomonadota bacterium]
MAGPQLHLDRSFDGEPGQPVQIATGVIRITAPNAGPYTFHGTNTYLLGQDTITIVDPGPDDDRHLQALISEVRGRTVEAIVITHTHIDHTELLPKLLRHIDAPIIGCGVHKAARPLAEGETNALDAAGDRSYAPDEQLRDDDGLHVEDIEWRTVETPGHTMNHICLFDPNSGTLVSGDHIMAWSTSIIAPPDGKMSAYMQSLEKLLPLNIRECWPGHGGPVKDPSTFIRALIEHRKGREQAARRALEKGPQTIAEMVPSIYIGLDERLVGAARLSLFAQVEDLVERGKVTAEGPVKMDAIFRLT